MRFYKHFFMVAVALVIAACVGFTSCKDDDDENDSKHPLTGYWVSEDGESYYYFHPNGCGFCGALRDNPPEIYNVFESYAITNNEELVIYWLEPDFSTDPDNKGKISVGKDSFTTKYNNFIKKGNDYPYALNFQGEEYYGYTAAELLKWWNNHTK